MDGFKTCTTDQLSQTEKQGICALFQESFHIEKSLERFEQEFTNTCKGYSYHCVYQKDDRILASFCLVPYEYFINGEKALFCLSVDTVVSPKAKLGPFGVADMAAETERIAAEDGCSVLYGFPNDNFYDYCVNVLEWEKIGVLDIYLVPFALGNLKKGLSFLNFLRFFTIFFLYLRKVFSSSKEITFPITKNDTELFRKGRYDQRHHFVKLKHGTAAYTLYQESFGPVAYIIDINPLSSKSFHEAFLTVALEVKDQAAMIAYPSGRLPFGRIIRPLRRYLPRKLHMVAHGLNGHGLPEPCKQLCNWKINLSDFDVR